MKIYLAGPDVFRKDAELFGKRLVKKCEKYGFEALFPLDNVIEDFKNDEITAKNIFKANRDMIKEADIVMANMVQFRGPSTDVGTAWEMGMGYSLGKFVIGYNTGMRTLVDKTSDFHGLICSDFPHVENFNLTDNLMLNCSCNLLVEDFDTALEFLNKFHDEILTNVKAA